MKPWRMLTVPGRLRRLRKTALRALEMHPLEARRLRLVGGFVNAVYRADTPAGPVAVRVERQLAAGDEQTVVELDWLAALSRDSEIAVARPLVAADGCAFRRIETEGVPGARRCTVFDWIGGRPLGDRFDVEGHRQLGSLAARLHLHGESYVPPLRPMRWDRVFYWPEEVDPCVIDSLPAREQLGPLGPLVDRARVSASRLFEQLPPHEHQVVHGDLHPWNVHRLRGRLIAFDFEDVMWAHPAQDIAITLSYSQGHVEREALWSAYRAGYEAIRRWPASEERIAHAIAARQLMFINMLINTGSVAGYLKMVAPRLRAYLQRWG